MSKIKLADYNVLVRPLVTEKSQDQVQYNKYSFEVAPDASKSSVRQAIENIFGVKVEKVNIVNVKGKVKRFRGILGKRKDVKKAIITLKEGDVIDVTVQIKGK